MSLLLRQPGRGFLGRRCPPSPTDHPREGVLREGGPRKNTGGDWLGVKTSLGLAELHVLCLRVRHPQHIGASCAQGCANPTVEARLLPPSVGLREKGPSCSLCSPSAWGTAGSEQGRRAVSVNGGLTECTGASTGHTLLAGLCGTDTSAPPLHSSLSPPL